MRIALLAVAVTSTTLLIPANAKAADPTTADCLGATDEALKLGNEHKLRAERAQLLVCAAASCPADIAKDCTGRIEQLNAQIPTIIFTAKDGSGADLSGVKVTMDGEVLVNHLAGTGLSVDPGEHTFTFETAGQPTVTKKFLVQASQKDRHELIAFGAPATPSTSTPTDATDSGGGLGGQKIGALVAGGVGVVGLGLGAVFGIVAMSQKGTAQSACPNTCATQDGVNDWNSAASSATISTVAFIVGGVGLAGAAALWFTAPSGTSASAQVGLGPSGIQLRGTW
jgi:hypothetical protein